MADEHRRVDPRGIVGSGMMTDPERIEQLEHDRDRIERTWRDAPKKKFGQVLTEAPARKEDDEDVDEEEQRAAPEPVDVGEEQTLPRVPPDPRMARLHAMLPSTSNKPGRKGP